MASETKNGELQVPCCLPVTSAHIQDLPLRNLKLTGKGHEQSLAVGKEWFWENGTTIHVRFLNSNATHARLEHFVKEAAEIWAKYANVHFVFDNSPNAMMRVLFDDNMPGGRSVLGKLGHEKVGKEAPTMTLGTNLSDKVFRRTALHELGHVLGCIHEHCSPAATFKWNEDKVIHWWLEQGPEYTRDWVEKNVLIRYPSDTFQTTLFDKRSIMIYPILPGWTEGGEMVDWPDELSPADKMLIARVYPPIMTTEMVTYHTRETRRWDQPQSDNIKKVKVTNPLKKELELAVGLTHFDLKSEKSMHLAASAESFDHSTFDLHLFTGGSTMYSAGATCMVAEKYTPRLQTGTYTTQDKDLIEKTVDDKEYKSCIKFTRPFEEPPHVIVWLKAFDFESGYTYAINAYAEGVTKEGFYMRIDTIRGARLNSAEVSWVAFEKDPANLKSGRLSFESFRKDRDDQSRWPKKHQVKETDLGQWQLTKLYAGLSKFRFDPAKNVRMAVDVQCANSSFKVDATTWADSICEGVDVSYLAVCI